MIPLRSLPKPHAALAVATLALVAPLAGAHEEPVDHTIQLDYYLLKDDQGVLAMSGLAPSARNATEWKLQLSASSSDKVSYAVRLDFPAPDHLLEESRKVDGQMKVNFRKVGGSAVPLHMGFLEDRGDIKVYLVEGDRKVRLGESHFWGHGYEQKMKLEGDYPGHENGGSPHTHGRGNDPSRGLFVSDLAVDIVFTLDPGDLTTEHTPVAYEFVVVIDGNSFVHLRAVGPAEAPPEPTPEPSPEAAPEAAGQESGDPDGEGGNGTNPPASGGGPSAPEPAIAPAPKAKTLSAVTEPLGATVSLSLAGLLAGLGVGLVAWTRRRRRAA